MRFRWVHLFVSALLVSTVVLAQGDAETAIRGIPDRWAELFNEGNYQGLVDLYTEDGVFVDAFGLFDPEAIPEALAMKLPVAPGEATMHVTTTEVQIYDDAAFATGPYSFSAPDGSTMMQGNWIAILEPVDGEWKMHRHVASMLMPEPVGSDVEEAVYALSTRWAELYNEGDFQGVADLYTEDAIVVNFNGRANEGREAIYEGLAQPMPEPLDQGTIAVTTEEAEVFGDTAHGMGKYVFSAPDGSIMMQGTYMAISKLVDGEWKMHRHLVNMLMPEPEADAP